VEFIVRLVLKPFTIAAAELVSPAEEIRGQVDLLHAEGSVVKAERDRLGGLLDLSELDVADVMVHRTAMETVNADESARADHRPDTGGRLHARAGLAG